MDILALDIGGTFVKTGYFQDGAPACFEEFPTEAQQGADHMVSKLCDYIRSKSPSHVSISTSGLVDPTTGKIVFATDAFPGYRGFQLLDFVQQKTGIPVTVENDANCAAIGEATFGAGRGLTDFVCITYGTGIGGGVYIGGKLYTGHSGFTLELGHIVTHAEGLQCSCGQRGCYELYASTSALVRKAEKKGLARNGRELYERRADPGVAQLLDTWCDEVVAGLVTLTRAYNPQAIILGGGLMTQLELVQELQQRYASQTLPLFCPTTLIPAALGNLAGVYGAYALAQQKQNSNI